jgi:hypothetical protein
MREAIFLEKLNWWIVFRRTVRGVSSRTGICVESTEDGINRNSSDVWWTCGRRNTSCLWNQQSFPIVHTLCRVLVEGHHSHHFQFCWFFEVLKIIRSSLCLLPLSTLRNWIRNKTCNVNSMSSLDDIAATVVPKCYEQDKSLGKWVSD